MKGEKGRFRLCHTYGGRAKMIDVTIFGPLCLDADGIVYHVGTGLNVMPPGVEIADPKGYLQHLLDKVEPYLWDELAKMEWGKKVPGYLSSQVLAIAKEFDPGAKAPRRKKA